MKKLLVCIMSFCFIGNFAKSQNLALIPFPQDVKILSDSFTLQKDITIIANEIDNQLVSEYLYTKIKSSTGYDLSIHSKRKTDNFIQLKIEKSSLNNPEAYSLKISKNQIVITSSSSKGLFYGVQTLLQLLPANIESANQVNANWKIPCVEITDAPRFAWRGFLLDVCRHFIPIESIKKQLDMMAMFKLNKFHWHLTDDQGWRIEIKKYPLLTSIGSKRIEANGFTHEGFYTQEQIKEIVAYAARLQIDVIPEIELPGHAMAALSAYPNLSCKGGVFTPRIVWGVETDVFCAGNEEVFTFLENVFKELIPLFPYEYYHVGGDECPKTRWKTCEKCQKIMKDNNIKTYNDLQAYVIIRMEKVLSSMGKKMFGWDEIIDGNIPTTAGVTSWRGEEGGIKAANKGHDVVMSPGKFCYLDKYQGDKKIEPITIGGLLYCKTIYDYNPVPEAISKDKAHHIKGVQANYWGEYLFETSKLEYMLYPRLLALAEMSWTNLNKKDYSRFEKNLDAMYPRLDLHQINYYVPQPEGSTNQIAFIDSVKLNFTTTLPVQKIVYTTDGTIPNQNSKTYNNHLIIKESCNLKISSILSNGRMSAIRNITLNKQTLQSSVSINTNKHGLKCKKANGKFRSVDEIATITNWEISTIDSIAQANKTLKWGFLVDSTKFGATILEAYIEIPEDGVYFFTSDQDQVLIDGKLLINNDKQPKRYSRNDGSIALAKGKHHLKIVYLNNIVDGWASDWNTLKLEYRKSTDEKFRKVGSDLLWIEE